MCARTASRSFAGSLATLWIFSSSPSGLIVRMLERRAHLIGVLR
jgi:hypothetical protein